LEDWRAALADLLAKGRPLSASKELAEKGGEGRATTSPGSREPELAANEGVEAPVTRVHQVDSVELHRDEGSPRKTKAHEKRRRPGEEAEEGAHEGKAPEQAGGWDLPEAHLPTPPRPGRVGVVGLAGGQQVEG
jgi:hypothetical protein